MSRQNKTANQYTVCILGLSRQRKRIWWMGLWTVAWWSQTRHHCIRHHPGPWTSNRRFIGHSFCLTSKGEGDSHKNNDTAEQFMQTEGGLCQLLHPLSGTDKSWSETPYKMLFQFSPGVVQLACCWICHRHCMSQFFRRCHLFHLATLSLEVAHLFF